LSNIIINPVTLVKWYPLIQIEISCRFKIYVLPYPGRQ
jgi:hypothetical protein